MSKNFKLCENFQNGGHQIPEYKLENQPKKNFTEQGITHVHIVLAVPVLNNWCQGPPTTRDTGTQRKKIQNYFTKNTKITPQNGGEINLRIIGSI